MSQASIVLLSARDLERLLWPVTTIVAVDHNTEIDMNRPWPIAESMASRAQGAVRDCPV